MRRHGLSARVLHRHGPFHHRVDALAEPPRRRRRRVPDGPEHVDDIGARHLGHRLLAEAGEGDALEAQHPVPGVLLVAPAGLLLVPHLLGGGGERGQVPPAALLGQRVAAGTGKLTIGEGLGAGVLERDHGVAAEAQLAAPTADGDSLNPASAARRLHVQVQPMPIAIPARFGDCAHERVRECVHGMSPARFRRWRSAAVRQSIPLWLRVFWRKTIIVCERLACQCIQQTTCLESFMGLQRPHFRIDMVDGTGSSGSRPPVPALPAVHVPRARTWAQYVACRPGRSCTEDGAEHARDDAAEPQFGLTPAAPDQPDAPRLGGRRRQGVRAVRHRRLRGRWCGQLSSERLTPIPVRTRPCATGAAGVAPMAGASRAPAASCPTRTGLRGGLRRRAEPLTDPGRVGSG